MASRARIPGTLLLLLALLTSVLVATYEGVVAKRQRAAAVAAVASKEKIVAQLTEDLKKLKVDLQERNERLGDVRGERDGLVEEKAALGKQLQETQTIADTAAKDKERVDTEKEALQKTIEERDRQLLEAEKQKLELQEQLQVLRDEKEVEKKKAEELKEEHDRLLSQVKSESSGNSGSGENAIAGLFPKRTSSNSRQSTGTHSAFRHSSMLHKGGKGGYLPRKQWQGQETEEDGGEVGGRGRGSEAARKEAEDEESAVGAELNSQGGGKGEGVGEERKEAEEEMAERGSGRFGGWLSKSASSSVHRSTGFRGMQERKHLWQDQEAEEKPVKEQEQGEGTTDSGRESASASAKEESDGRDLSVLDTDGSSKEQILDDDVVGKRKQRGEQGEGEEQEGGSHGQLDEEGKMSRARRGGSGGLHLHDTEGGLDDLDGTGGAKVEDGGGKEATLVDAEI